MVTWNILLTIAVIILGLTVVGHRLWITENTKKINVHLRLLQGRLDKLEGGE